MSDDDKKVSFDESGFSFSLGGLTSGKIAIIFAAISTIVGSLWAGFQVYQQFLTMKEVTAAYVPPDLSGINERISVLDERVTSVERLTKGNSEALNYISGSVSGSLTSTRQTVDAVSSSVRSSDAQNMAMQRAIIQQLRDQDKESQERIKALQGDLDAKIQKTLANPLAGGD